MDSGVRVGGFPCKRAFNCYLSAENLALLHRETNRFWGPSICVTDPMARGGLIPLESARLAFRTVANEYNPVACSLLEATVDYPFRFGEELGTKARRWGQALRKRFIDRMERFFPKTGVLDSPDGYIFARTVPCPDTKEHPPTPLVPDWHLLKPKGGGRDVVAEPLVGKNNRTWSVQIRTIGQKRGQLHEAPQPTYIDGRGISLFSHQQISADYIQAKAQAGEMKSTLYALVINTPQGLTFQPPNPRDVQVLNDAERELARLLPKWQETNVIPTESVPVGDKTGDFSGKGTDLPLKRGERKWTDMFSSRQLLCIGVLVEELQNLRSGGDQG
jgi:adenine-specific DNA methylase